MTTENEVSEEEQQSENPQEQEAKQIILAVYARTLQMLQAEFETYQVEGQIINNPNYGPLFAYRLKEADADKEYACGFFINELLEKHKDAERASQWLASFYIDMIDSGISKPLQTPPGSEDDTKKLFDEYIVPHCAKSVREEFSPEQVYVDLDMHEQIGPVLEAGFPAIKDGNNVCAMPFHYLLTLHLMNRDPADPLVHGLYKIREEHGLE
ncbi:hypothetical protein SAMN04487969_11323 [Paenibacillus algorifonticola]|uniref:Uncharacterized protein n=1 Tax=Paenibacillus algorifonticola TaxID=684063 RepID=A0A1I2FSB3_9BACL|nr:hypothetical protein [Paenibacillus algorifonticola]SFF07341.1 hypothetical protein SAMN04487969_11323 [Paenibacillus algorifonticola]